MTSLRLDRLSKHFGTNQALADLSLEVAPGEGEYVVFYRLNVK